MTTHIDATDVANQLAGMWPHARMHVAPTPMGYTVVLGATAAELNRLITHADMRRMPDGATVYNDIHERWVKHGPWWHLDDGDTRLLGTELKRLSAWLYVLEPFNPARYVWQH